MSFFHSNTAKLSYPVYTSISNTWKAWPLSPTGAEVDALGAKLLFQFTFPSVTNEVKQL